MITFTKEQLIASAHARIEFAEMMLAGELEPLKERTWSIELELARIALASLEAQAVVFRSKLKPPSSIGSEHWDYTDHRQPDAFELESCVIERLFTEPPAPVAVPAGYRLQPISEYDAMCSAMLQGAEGKSPDCWVACSERMPDIGTEIFYFCQDDGLRDCGIVSSSNFSGKANAELYVHAEGYDLRFGVDITHWMPLPAAPNSGD